MRAAPPALGIAAKLRRLYVVLRTFGRRGLRYELAWAQFLLSARLLWLASGWHRRVCDELMRRLEGLRE